MKHAVIRVLSGGLLCVSLYTFSSSVARADDWGCQVLLCLSNPGSPTEYVECRPPIERLWSHLAKGRSFPICSGVGFTASKPRYEPYYCDTGFRLVTRSGDRGRNEVGCVSTEAKVVSNQMCRRDDSGGATGRWYFEEGQRVCKAFITKRPNVREQPRYVDVTIDGAGRQRVWF
ncbi:hypothetical protein J3U99_21425 [Brucella pituitosa]|uniref:hypothetical protein n=1 Tax=Brucella pituitosa TaxID=571256 RepID=UPI002003E55F|nr:hypothetical protein [Brucella pituitosa]MCK4207326.1 hypothetical protein [Brucella pituitosa]